MLDWCSEYLIEMNRCVSLTELRMCFCDVCNRKQPLLFYFNMMKCASPMVLLEFQCPTPQVCVLSTCFCLWQLYLWIGMLLYFSCILWQNSVDSMWSFSSIMCLHVQNTTRVHCGDYCIPQCTALNLSLICICIYIHNLFSKHFHKKNAGIRQAIMWLCELLQSNDCFAYRFIIIGTVCAVC